MRTLQQFLSSLELYVFVSTSTTIYTLVVYVPKQMDVRVHTQVLTAITRFAPIKTLHVPFKELCVAFLGAQLSQAVKKPSMTAVFPIPKSLLGRVYS